MKNTQNKCNSYDKLEMKTENITDTHNKRIKEKVCQSFILKLVFVVTSMINYLRKEQALNKEYKFLFAMKTFSLLSFPLFQEFSICISELR